jgi:arylsulfatase
MIVGVTLPWVDRRERSDYLAAVGVGRLSRFLPVVLAVGGLVVGVLLADPLRSWFDAWRKPPNLLIVLVDALRADHLGAYGYHRKTSPAMDVFAAGNVIFTNARSQASCTYPSVNSLLTSRYPQDFLGQPEKRFGIPDSIPSLAQLLKKRGYRTVAVSASLMVRRSPTTFNRFGGFDAGFDVFDEECPLESARCVNGQAFTHLVEYGKPFFFYLHYMDPHGPYRPPHSHKKRFALEYDGKASVKLGVPAAVQRMFAAGRGQEGTEEDLQHLVDLYDDEIAFFDSQFEILMSALEARGLMDDLIIVIAADHGEEFLEHGKLVHCHSLHDVLIKTPLIIKVPGVKGGRQVTTVAQNLDIVPTVLDYMGIDTAGYGFKGSSLRPAIEKRKRVYEYGYSFQGALRAVYDDRYKLIYDVEKEKYELFDVVADPGETHSISGREPETLARMRESLFEWLRRAEGGIASEDTLRQAKEAEEQLRAVGYIE